MNITILSWFGIFIGITIFCIGMGLAFYNFKKGNSKSGGVSILISLTLSVLIIGGILFYSSTETGKRSFKDQQSNILGGINRTITVYDVNGKIIKEYTGEFDVETDNPGYLLFDDENGKRHIIYYTTGTITIDEN